MNFRSALLAFGVSFVLTRAANAQTSTDESAYGQGAALRTQHRDAEALELFQRLHATTGQPRALAQMALAEGALGHWVDAETHLSAALAVSADPWVQRNRAALVSAQRTIAEHLGSLDVRSPTPGAELWLQGRRVAALPLAQAARVVAGTVAFEVRAAGHVTVQRVAAVAAGGLARETVELVPEAAPARAPVVTASVATAPASPSVVAPPTERARPGSTQRTLAWVSAGVAGVAVVGGAVALALRSSEVDEYNADSRCPGIESPTQPPPCLSRVNTASTLRALGITGFVAGGVFGVASVVLFVTAPSERRERTGLACGLGPGDLGVACRLSF